MPQPRRVLLFALFATHLSMLDASVIYDFKGEIEGPVNFIYTSPTGFITSATDVPATMLDPHCRVDFTCNFIDSVDFNDTPKAKAFYDGLHITVPGVPIAITGDPGRLRQVLTNLLGNAIKFAENGQIHFAFETLTSEVPGTFRLRFWIKDTGIGISPDQKNRLFQTFAQGDGTSTRKYGGTGLGLAISKQLVALLGGEIGVESELGRGSYFWFTATFGEPAPSEAEQLQQSANQDEKPRVGANGNSPAATHTLQTIKLAGALVASTGVQPEGHVLLAEDNAINQRIAVRLLQKLGLVVDAVANGREAVEAVKEREYDLILMDCQMPGIDGFEATKIMRKLEPGTHRTPICALTANAMEGDRERCLAAGMDDYICKPVDLEKLRETVARWIQRPAISSVDPDFPQKSGNRNPAVDSAQRRDHCL